MLKHRDRTAWCVQETLADSVIEELGQGCLEGRFGALVAKEEMKRISGRC